MFAYGTTGSGKTYTVSGGAKKRNGIIQQTVRRIRQKFIDAKFFKSKLSCYMIQLYKSDIVDLLRHSTILPVALEVIEDGRTGLIEIKGATLIQPTTKDFLAENGEEIFIKAINTGLDNRLMRATNANETSSRSHLVISFVITY